MTDSLSDLRHVNLPFDLDDVAPQCHACIRKQMKKYARHVDKHGKSAVGKFLVPCTGIPRNPLPAHYEATMDEEDKKTFLSSIDIPTFAEQYLTLPDGTPWVARSYQAQVLRCSSRRKMLRIARRTGKTDLVCVEICFKLFTKENSRIIVAGPQKTHTEEIINRIRGFIKRNPQLSAMVVRDVSAPYYEILLTNGSRVRGFAAGTKGKSEGVAIRGQDADDIYMEEMDYIDEKAISGAVVPILQTNPNTALVGFSTPSGFRTPYFKYCTDNPHYIEFHYTYKVLPWWRNIEMERSQFTQEDWDHEYLAEWGASEEGVYKPSYVDRALQTYRYEDLDKPHTWRYCVGTDWNEKHGTEIVVLGYNTLTGRFQVVYSDHIEKSDFTQLRGIERLLEINRIWKPSFIYIDAGNGSTNYEVLMATAQGECKPGGDRDTARLTTILKKYDAGASLKIKDPVTRQEIKVPAKPFMVNASVRLFEQGRIVISSYDDTMEKEIRNYIIERQTPTKVTVYGRRDDKIKDHRLDALNLAIVAFHLEFDDLHKEVFVTTMGAALDPRTLSMSNRVVDRNTEHTPEERRMDYGAVKTLIVPIAAKRTSGTVTTIVDRPGWESDTEEIERLRYLQRKRSRSKVERNRPRRTNI